MKNTTTATRTATASAAPAEMDETLALLWEAQCGTPEEEVEERPSLTLVVSQALGIEPVFTPEEPPTERSVAPGVAPLARECPQCHARVANLPSVWSEKHNLCTMCAAPQLRNEEKAARIAARTCKCGNWKHETVPMCRDCWEAKKAADAKAAVTCPKCGGEKQAFHKVCSTCYHAARPQHSSPARPGQPAHKVDPAAQKRAEERTKLGNSLLAALRAGDLEKKFPGAEVKRDEENDPQVLIKYRGESLTVFDRPKAEKIARERAEAAKKAAIEAAARRAAEAEEKRRAAEARKLEEKTNPQPKKGKKDKSVSSDAKSKGKKSR